MLTIGHSTLALTDFLGALRQCGCVRLVDVRRYPGSRRNPQFGQDVLFRELEAAGIEAIWREGLGGRRTPRENSMNRGWRNESFRGYADYMQTAEFEAEMDWLMVLPELERTVVMCAEAVPWRCHRSLIGDAVLARGGEVSDIFVNTHGLATRKVHAMTSFARVDGARVWYPAEEAQVDLFEQ